MLGRTYSSGCAKGAAQVCNSAVNVSRTLPQLGGLNHFAPSEPLPAVVLPLGRLRLLLPCQVLKCRLHRLRDGGLHVAPGHACRHERPSVSPILAAFAVMYDTNRFGSLGKHVSNDKLQAS